MILAPKTSRTISDSTISSQSVPESLSGKETSEQSSSEEPQDQHCRELQPFELHQPSPVSLVRRTVNFLSKLLVHSLSSLGRWVNISRWLDTDRSTTNDTHNITYLLYMMDFCRRRLTQRAASNDGQAEDSAASQWDYSAGGRQTTAQANALARGSQQQHSHHRQRQPPHSPTEPPGGQQLARDGLLSEAQAMAHELVRLEHQHQRQQQHQRQLERQNTPPEPAKSLKHPTRAAHSFSSISNLIGAYQQRLRQRKQDNPHAAMHPNAIQLKDGQTNDGAEVGQPQMVLVSQTALSELTQTLALSLSKMSDIEEKVSVIPELQRRLSRVMDNSEHSHEARQADHQSARMRTSSNSSKLEDFACSGIGPSTSNHLDGMRSSPMCYQQSSSRYNSVTRSDRCAHPDAIGHSASRSRTGSLDTRASQFGEMRNSGLLTTERLDDMNNQRRRPFHVSSNSQSTQETISGDGSSSSRVEYEDLINDLISLSYSVNYLPAAASSKSRSQSPASVVGSQVKETPTDEQRDQFAQARQRQYSRSPSRTSLAGNASVQRPSNHNHNPIVPTESNSIGGCTSTPNSYHNNAASSHRSPLINNADGAISTRQRLLSSISNDCASRLTDARQSNRANCCDIRNSYISQTPGRQTRARDHLDAYQLSLSLHNNNNNNSISLSSNHLSNVHHTQASPATTGSTNRSMILDPSPSNPPSAHQNSFGSSLGQHHHNRSSSVHLTKNYHGSGSLSLQTTPVKTALDCGCQSFKEHIRYNSISREQRLNHAKSLSSSSAVVNSAPPQPTSQKTDASTNTDLCMSDIVTRLELNELVASMHKTYSTISPSQEASRRPNRLHKASSLASDSTSGSMTGPKSSSPSDSRSDSCDYDDRIADDENADAGQAQDESQFRKHSRSKAVQSSQMSVEEDDDNNDDDDEDGEANAASLNCGEPLSIGSSYQDPSDFEEYCAYGESLDRRTKDFMSQSTDIPNNLRFALIRLNDLMKRERPSDQIEASAGCMDVIRKEWFGVAANKDSQSSKVKLYIDYFENFTKQLLNTVVNLADNAGNTAMHYAASHYKLDVIKVLLETKVCDVNCRNRAGYTPIMLLALAAIESREDREVARLLFSMGDVNIKARSSGQTALMLAASHGRIDTCKLLLECGADPSLQDYDGSTALMCGSELGNEQVVRCLLAHKLTDPTATDNDGLDALTIAMNNGHKNIGLLLYAAKNVPRMVRSSMGVGNHNYNTMGGYLGASLRRSRGKLATNYVRRADSLLGSRSARSARHSEAQ